MMKIGFIDYFLDNWHSKMYPGWIDEATNGEMKVTHAFALSEKEGMKPNAEWCREKGIELLGSIEAVIEACDALVVLSPNNPEYHEELARLPLQSGKPVYIDKTFAPDRETAVRLFELAEKHGTPMYSSSALRYAAEYADVEKAGIAAVSCFGAGKFETYSIHQVEPIVQLMGTEAERVMWTGTDQSESMLLGFSGGRQAEIHHYGDDCPFAMALKYDNGKNRMLKIESNFFGAFIQGLTEFFRTREVKLDKQETIAIAAILENGRKAKENPYQWVELPKK
ncbi:Gfo/Idh/MocA family oxidoreductase [Paenibacillus sp. CC-CFT747]|nr:Gfo/Idh/MocA family oxidoreductase [Paenibacillus sp. CC-CFT747]